MSSQAAGTTRQRDSKPLEWGKYVVIVSFVGLALLPVAYYGANSEFARWKAARAELLYQQGKPEDGLELLNLAVEQAPHDQNLKLNLAEKLMRSGQADRALELIDSVIEYSANPRPAIEAKASCLMYLQRADEALTYIKSAADYLEPNEYQQPLRLNQLAYFRALAKKELNQAQDDISKSIKSTEEQLWWSDKYLPMSLADQTLVSTVIVSLQIEAEGELNALSKRIEELRTEINEMQNELSRGVYALVSDDLELTDETQTKLHFKQFHLLSNRHVLSILLVVRALVYQERGRQLECDLDRAEIIKMGFEPGDLLNAVPDDWILMRNMLYGAQLLDTDAVVKNAAGDKLAEASNSLDIAVNAISVLAATDDSSLQNTIRDESGSQFARQDLPRMEAVIRLHRAELKLRQGRVAEAEDDYRRIEKLGFSRQEPLF